MIAPSTRVLSNSAASVTTDELKKRVTDLYETSRDRIYRFLVGKGLRPQIAQEITQDVFVDLFRALARGTRIESEERWLFAVAARAVIDHWRRERYQTQVDFDSELNVVANARSSEPTPEAQVERKERLTRMAGGMRNLTREQRLCFELRAQGLRYREIGEVVGAPTSTVAEWIVSAIGSLRSQIEGDSPFAGRRAVAAY